MGSVRACLLVIHAQKLVKFHSKFSANRSAKSPAQVAEWRSDVMIGSLGTLYQPKPVQRICIQITK